MNLDDALKDVVVVNEPAPSIDVIEKLLKESPKFRRVGHARQMLGMQEITMASVLTLHYRGAQFLLRLAGSTALLRIPMSLTGTPLGLGKVDTGLLAIGMGGGPAFFIREVTEILDQAICPPITLTEFGDTMVFKAQVQDTTEISHLMPTHGRCGGIIDRRDVSDQFTAIHCRICNLRVMVPVAVTTVGMLRGWARRRLDRTFHAGRRQG